MKTDEGGGKMLSKHTGPTTGEHLLCQYAGHTQTLTWISDDNDDARANCGEQYMDTLLLALGAAFSIFLFYFFLFSLVRLLLRLCHPQFLAPFIRAPVLWR